MSVDSMRDINIWWQSRRMTASEAHQSCQFEGLQACWRKHIAGPIKKWHLD